MPLKRVNLWQIEPALYTFVSVNPVVNESHALTSFLIPLCQTRNYKLDILETVTKKMTLSQKLASNKKNLQFWQNSNETLS